MTEPPAAIAATAETPPPGDAGLQRQVASLHAVLAGVASLIEPVMRGAYATAADIDAAITDITGRKRAEEALHASESKYRMVVDTTDTGFAMLDETGKVLDGNAEYVRLTGCEFLRQILGRQVMEWTADYDRDRNISEIEKCLKTGSIRNLQIDYVTAAGFITPVEINATVLRTADETRIVALCRDIGTRKRAEARQSYSNVLLKAATESSPDGILVVDQAGRIVSSNQNFVEMWSIPVAMIEAHDDAPVLLAVSAQLKDPEKFTARVRHLYDHPAETGHDEIELIDGRVFDRHTASLNGEDGGYLGRIWFFRDITRRKVAENAIERLAHTDVLTGLANRATFLERIGHALAMRRRGSSDFAVIYFDLDHFKDVNDTLGHPVGDALLKCVAERLNVVTRDVDLAARFGGDEFALLLPDVKDEIGVGIMAQRLLDALSRPYSIEGHDIYITASIGIALQDASAMDAQILLRNADVALYRAEEEGRNAYRFYTLEMDTAVHDRVTMTEELRTAIALGQLTLHYQPQVDARDGGVKGVEALVRWNHPRRGLLLPDSFIRVADLTGLVAPLGKWVVNEACRQMKDWLDLGIAPPIMAINLSATEFKMVDLESQIVGILEKYGLPPDRFEFEITESTMMEVSGRHEDVLARLKRRGIRVSVDDFGTGYSSLAYLKRFRPDRIKIARDFVSGMLEDEADRAVTRAIIEMAQELRIGIIAEGVESAEQAKFLCDLGCCVAQGFAYSRAIPAADMTEALRRKTIFTLAEPQTLPIAV